MNIVMMTNTYFPHVGGVARSVESFTQEFRERGHRVMVIAPEFPNDPEVEEDVVRLPAIQKFNGSDFSIRLPVPGFLSEPLELFRPDIIHSHHPFLLGDTALRIASSMGLPLVFTHHTLYEQYTHYVSSHSEALKRFVVDLSTGYANLCDHVIAPSQSIADILAHRGVTASVTVSPTGVDLKKYTKREGSRIRQAFGIPREAFLIGHIGRLAPEKNLVFLTDAVSSYLAGAPNAWFLVVGTGPLEQSMKRRLEERGVSGRVRFAGILDGQKLVNAYSSMDVFAFASQSETQGLVVAEAMAAGTPVLAVDASGVREVVREGYNGRLLPNPDEHQFTSLLAWFAGLSPEAGRILARNARRTADQFSMQVTADKVLAIYHSQIKRKSSWELSEESLWSSAMRRIQMEWKLLSNIAHAAGTALGGTEVEEEKSVL